MSMPKKMIALALMVAGLTGSISCNPTSAVPADMKETIQADYSAWLAAPRLSGPCEDVSVVEVEWIEPYLVKGKRPIAWLNAHGKPAVILNLTSAQAEWIGGVVSAQPVMELHEVPVYRLCHGSAVTPW
jgi:hypothetical protein